jgi:exosortase C (VPDSG-CTERM-specific)
MNGISENPVTTDQVSLPVDRARNPASLNWRTTFPFLLASAVLILFFAKPLVDLAKYASSESFYSHILLVPIICGYLVWTERASLPPISKGRFALPLTVAGLGAFILLVYFLNRAELSKNDAITWTILPFCLFLTSLVMLFLGSAFSRAVAFPLGFLFFIVPFPEALTNAMEIGSQIASAEVYSWMLTLTGTPFLRDGQEFRLPGLALVVAQECSGIRSSFVLFLTSLLAGPMFLKFRWNRAFFAFVVIPLGLVRNGFRVLTLSLLTIYVDPRVIESPLHHRGGPIFFALSLIPFFLLLGWLRKTERKHQGSAASPN